MIREIRAALEDGRLAGVVEHARDAGGLRARARGERAEEQPGGQMIPHRPSRENGIKRVWFERIGC